jgi:hypothetical protein
LLRLKRAHDQYEAVEEIQRHGGYVFYRHEIREDGDLDYNAQTPGPLYLRRLFGDDMFRHVVVVHLGQGGMANVASLPFVRHVTLDYPITAKDLQSLNSLRSLPGLRTLKLFCKSDLDESLFVHLAQFDHLQGLVVHRDELSEQELELLRKTLPNCAIGIAK